MEPQTARFILQQTVLLLLFAITAPLTYYIFNDMLFRENQISFHGSGDSIIDYQYTHWAAKYTKDTSDVTIGYNNDTVIQVSLASLDAESSMFVPYDDLFLNGTISNIDLPGAVIATGASAIAVIFNSHASTKTLRLSQQALVGIFSCTVTHWNDTLIQSSNPSITLPYSPIIPLHFNSVPSSQTFVFSDALCEFSGQWCDQYGVGSNITWCANQDQNITNDFEMLSAVQTIPFSIGYISLQADVVMNASSTIASVANAMGQYLFPNQSFVQNVMNFVTQENLTWFDSISNLNCSSCYPITGWTYMYLQENYDKYCHSNFKKLIDFIQFIYKPENLYPAQPSSLASFVLPNNATMDEMLNFVEDSLLCNGESKSEISSTKHFQPGRVAVVAEAMIVFAVFVAQVIWFYRERNKLKYTSARRTNQFNEITPFLQEWGSGYSTNSTVEEPPQYRSAKQLHPTVREMKVGENMLEFWGVIKRSGFGDIYEGRWNRDPCIIKKIVLADKPEVIEELAHEISTITRIRHPNIVQFYAVSLKHPMFFIISEYCSNGGLNALLEETSLHLPLSQRLQYAIEAATGMAHLHSLRIIHRDLKISNMLLDSNNVVKIADYSISKFVDEPAFFSSEESARTRAPEISEDGKHGHTTQSDVFSFGICLYEILTRSHAFADATSLHIRRAILAGNRPPTGDIWPKEVASLVESCWDANPARRPSFAEIIRTLNSLSTKNLYLSNKSLDHLVNNNSTS